MLIAFELLRMTKVRNRISRRYNNLWCTRKGWMVMREEKAGKGFFFGNADIVIHALCDEQLQRMGINHKKKITAYKRSVLNIVLTTLSSPIIEPYNKRQNI